MRKNTIAHFSHYLCFQIEKKLSTEERKNIINSLFERNVIGIDTNCVQFYQNIVHLFESSFWWQFERKESGGTENSLNLSHTSEMNMKCIDFILNDTIKHKQAAYSMFDDIQQYQVLLEKKNSGKEEDKDKTKARDADNVPKQQYLQFLSNFSMLETNANDENNGEYQEIQEIQSMVRNSLIIIGISNQIYDNIGQSQSIDATNKLFEKYYSLDLIDPCCITMKHPRRESLYHIAASYNQIEIFNLLTEIDNDCTKFQRMNDDKSAKEIALEQGKWAIYEKILFSKKGAKMKEKVLKEKNRLDLQRGTAHRFLNVIDKDSEAGMEELVSIMIDLLNNRQPISDDMLLACWKYETSKKEFINENKFESKLWIAIESIANQVLQLPLNKVDFVWFKSYSCKDNEQQVQKMVFYMIS